MILQAPDICWTDIVNRFVFWHDSDSLQTVDRTPCFCLFSSEVYLRAVTDKLIFTPHFPEFTKAQWSCSFHVLLKYKHTHYRNRCHRQQDSQLSIHTASGFIDSEGERVCSYKQHTGVLLKHTLQTLYINQSMLCKLNA